MEYHSAKNEELSEQLASWWRTQTDFETKKALAGFLKVHPDTLGDYFSGRKFPRSDIANRLSELTSIECLKGYLGKNPEATAGQLPRKLTQKGGRQEERSVVISLQRTNCPFCAHNIARFHSCDYCGQHFVWANVPLEYGEPV